ncbi:MAG: hypothetical protein HW416_959 [Chloroflexi bacterium]|nr:hypothetical protein [Chloroflexota bacterium]
MFPSIALGHAFRSMALISLVASTAAVVPLANVSAGDPPPKRVITDPNPGFSGVWVDTVNDEIVVSDDAHHSVVTYARTASGPTAPLRQIIGESTRIDFPTTAVVDTVNGEVWTTMNDTAERAVAFPRTANGNVQPARIIDFTVLTPGQFPSNRSWGLAIDPVNDEVAAMFQRNPGGAARILGGIGVFDRTSGNVKRRILGLGSEDTFADPHGIFIDAMGNEIFGTTEGLRRGLAPTDPSIVVFDRMADGNVQPLRQVKGSRTGLSIPKQIHVDTVNGHMAVANGGNHSITIFDSKATGNVAPLRTIAGPRTGLKDPTGVFIDAKNNEIVVTNWGNHSITVFARNADGNVAPLRTLTSSFGGPQVGFGNPASLGLDIANQEFVITNCVSHPRIATFDLFADGQVPPKRVLYGPKTRIGRTAHGIWLDPTHGEIAYVNEPEDSILIFDRLAEGDTPPIRVIQGPDTGLYRLNGGIMVDVVNDEIVVVAGAAPGARRTSIAVFDRLAEGNATPKRMFTSPDFTGSPVGIWSDPVYNEIYTAGGDEIFVFDRLAEGSVSPKRIILEDGTGGGSFQQVVVDVVNDEIVVANNGQRGSDPPLLGAVVVYDRLAEGVATPKRFIQDAGVSGVQFPRAVWVDLVNDEIGEADSKQNDVKVFPRVW